MAEKKKKQSAEFAKDKNAFAGGASAKGDNAKNAKQKQSGAHQPTRQQEGSQETKSPQVVRYLAY